MKIRVIGNYHNGFTDGEIIEAAISPNGTQAVAFNNMNNSWFFTSGQFQVLGSKEHSSESFEHKSLRELIGQDMTSININFK